MSTWEPNADRETAVGSAVEDDPDERGAVEVTRDEVSRDEGGDQLARLAGLPLAEHPAVYERIHGELQSALADIDGA